MTFDRPSFGAGVAVGATVALCVTFLLFYEQNQTLDAHSQSIKTHADQVESLGRSLDVQTKLIRELTASTDGARQGLQGLERRELLATLQAPLPQTQDADFATIAATKVDALERFVQLERELAPLQKRRPTVTGLQISGIEFARFPAMDGFAVLGLFAPGARIPGRLESVNFAEANLAGANLAGSTWVDASLRNSQLSNTDFRGATLENVDLSGARLCNANLTTAKLTSVLVSDSTDLFGARLPAESDSQLKQQWQASKAHGACKP